MPNSNDFFKRAEALSQMSTGSSQTSTTDSYLNRIDTSNVNSTTSNILTTRQMNYNADIPSQVVNAQLVLEHKETFLSSDNEKSSKKN